jgi:glutathione S-transferase
MIDLYSWPAPNGHRMQILVEELGTPYRMIPIDITRGAQPAALPRQGSRALPFAAPARHHRTPGGRRT